jgi:hypothetical protein
MAGKPRNMAKKSVEQSTLLEALKFIGVAQRFDDKASVNQKHCVLVNRTAVAFDGALAAGTPIEEDVAICPHTKLFIDALLRCGQSFTLTQLDETKVKIATAKFSAFVPCLPRQALPDILPDPNIAPLSDALKTALGAVAGLVKAEGATVVEATALVRAGSCVATDRHVMLEAWHGHDLPQMALPKVAINALLKTSKVLCGFGYSGNTATFWFEDGSWIRTQLWDAKYPDIDKVFNQPSNAWPVPAEFFEAVRAVAPFNEAGQIIFGQNCLRSHDQEQVGATREVNGIPKGIRYGSRHLLMAEPYIKTIDFVGKDGVGFFFNGNVRGAITQLAKTYDETLAEERVKWEERRNSPEYKAEQVAIEERRQAHIRQYGNDSMFDDIPF